MSLVSLFIRLLLAFIFLGVGFSGLANRAGLHQILRDSGVPALLADPLSVLLPLTELVVAIALLPVSTVWWAALAACTLLLLSVASMGYRLARRRQMEQQTGQLPGTTASWSRLVRCLVLAAIAGFIVWQGRQGVGPGVLDWFAPLTTAQRIGLLVALILFALLLLEGWLQFHSLSQQGRMLQRIEALEGHSFSDEAKAEVESSVVTGLSVGHVVPLLSSLTAAAEEDHRISSLASGSMQPAITPSAPEKIELTIGMATYNDFDGVYFTLQALRLYQDLENTELLVIDNYGCDETKNLVEKWIKGARYVRAAGVTGTAAPRDLVFREARGNAVLCCDCHILFAPGVIARLKQFYREHPYCHDLLQGPLVFDDLENIATHFEPEWRAQMWGTWGTDPRGQDPQGEPFEIPMQGLGVFSCLKRAWLGFNPEFRGFGGEEGYIHEKFRQAGRRCLCLPWFRWMHRFSRPGGVKYPLTVEEKLRNYVIGHTELGLDLTPVLEHFAEHLPREQVMAVTKQALGQVWEGTLDNSSKEAPAQVQETVRIVTISENDSLYGRLDQASNPAQLSDEEKVPLVSVVLPVYNGELYLRAAVESLLGQTFQNIEVIIVNDGSTDQTPQIINELSADPRVKTVHQRNMGMAQARNRGIDLARAEYIVAHDADDISLPDRLKKQYTFLEQALDYGLIGTYIELIDETGQVLKSPEVSVDPGKLQVVMVERLDLLERNYFAHGSVVMRKSACEAVGKYRDVFLLADDYDLWLRMAEKYRTGNLADALYQYRSHPTNISKTKGHLLQAYTDIVRELAYDRRQSGSDLLMREGSAAFWHKYGAQLKAAGLPEQVMALR